MVFVGGLHRSGTSLIGKQIAAHPDASGLTGTGAWEDEGQKIQDVYPTAKQNGGYGRFALAAASHLTEASPLCVERSRERLLDAWRPFWDMSKDLLVEKSPPNLLMTRFLQRLFPEARFIMVVRHPIAVSLSTRKWANRTSLSSLMDNWLQAHETFLGDVPLVDRLLITEYEKLIAQPDHAFAEMSDFLELDSPIVPVGIRPDLNAGYARQWDQLLEKSSVRGRLSGARRVARSYADRVAHYGYDLHDLSTSHGLPAPPSLAGSPDATPRY